MIDLDELAARVQGQVAGVLVEHDRDGDLVDLRFVDGPGWHTSIQVHLGGMVCLSACTYPDDEGRQLIRAVLDELDRQQSTPTDHPAEGAGG